MFRLQPPDTVTSSGPGLGRWQRLGRADQIHTRGEHPATKARQSQRLRGAGVLPIASGARLGSAKR